MMKILKGQIQEGVFLVDKPKGVTSYSVVRRFKKIFPGEKVGHAGTLDPLAEGLLIILVGRKATRRQSEFMKLTKQYKVKIIFGVESETYDLEGKLVFDKSKSKKIFTLSKELIKRAVGGFGHSYSEHQQGSSFAYSEHQRGSSFAYSEHQRGSSFAYSEHQRGSSFAYYQQVPLFSAVKVGGSPLYRLARQGKRPIDIPSKEVEIKKMILCSFRPADESSLKNWDQKEVEEVISILPEVELLMEVGKGFYVRSFASDLGKKLGVGGVVTKLVRTKIGSYRLDRAIKMTDLEEFVVVKEDTRANGGQ